MRRSLFFWWVLVFFATSSYSQSTGKISGVVVDPDQAAVPDASVRLLSKSGAELAHTLSDRQGAFIFQQQCTDCSVEVQLTGFVTQRVPASESGEHIELHLAPVEERVVVTANRVETPAVLVGSTTTVISKEEIEDRQASMVSDLLGATPGSTVARTGGYGASTSLFLRGGESNYTKVLLDGIPLNDPGGAFDFGSLSTANIDHVEIVRGPQSALFGSDAMTGVVQLFSTRGESETTRPQISLYLEGGNLGTINAGASIGGESGGFDYSAFWSRFSTDNQVANADFADSTAGTNLGWKRGKTKLRWILRDDLSYAGTPGQTAFQPAITDAYFHRGDGYTGLSIENETNRFWNQRLTYTFDRSRQRSRDLGLDPPYTPRFGASVAPFEFSDFPDNFVNDTRRHQLDYQSNVVLGSGASDWGQHTFTLGFSAEKEIGAIGDRNSGPEATTHASLNDVGGVFQYQAIVGRLSLTNGFRVESHSLFGKTVTPRSSAAYLLRQGDGNFGATKLKFNFGLGFKEPSLVDLFSPDLFFQGNPQLRPERNRSFDFGVEQRLWNDRAKLEVNWFDNRFRDLVEFETTNFQTLAGTFINVNAAKANGAEVILETTPKAGLKLTAAYTYLNSQITQSSTPVDSPFQVGNALLRRPRHSGSLGALWTWRRLTASSTVIYVGRRVDSDFEDLFPPLTSDPSYTRWDLAGSYRFSKKFEYTGAITNLLDRRYMEGLGYPALPIEFRTGGRITF